MLVSVHQAPNSTTKVNRIRLATVILLATMLLTWIVPALVEGEASRAGDEVVTDINPLLDDSEQIYRLMVDQESGERGYIITANPQFLAPYTAASTTLAGLWPQAEAGAARLGGQIPALLEAAHQAATRWQDDAATPAIASVQGGSPGQAVKLVSSGLGRQLFDAFRSASDQLTTYLTRVRDEASAERDGWLKLRDQVQVGLALVGLIALGSLYYITNTAGRLQELVVRAQALSAAKDQFLNLASHELKTPVTSIKGHAQMLLRRARAVDEGKVGDWDKVRAQAVVIEQQASKLVRMVEELLELGRIQTQRVVLEYSPTEMVALSRAVISEAQAMAPNHHLSLEAEPSEVILNVDRQRIEEVLHNLVSNAVKYSPAGGEVVISLTVGDGELTCAVRDEGMGIAAAEQGEIFKLFYRASNVSSTRISGLGIGLYLSKTFVEWHGGLLWAESRVGEGSTFYFRLPLV